MKTLPRLPRLLRLTGLAILLATFALWLGTGAHTGWTQTSVAEMRRDEVTGIDFPVERAKFVAGVEILALGLGLGAALGAGAFLVARRRRIDG